MLKFSVRRRVFTPYGRHLGHQCFVLVSKFSATVECVVHVSCVFH